MGKQMNLVAVEQRGPYAQFYNRINGSLVVAVELSNRATYTENATYVLRVAEAVEDFLEELVDRSIAVNIAHRRLFDVTIVNVTPLHKTIHLVNDGRIMARIQEYSALDALNNLSLENKIGAAVEDYVRTIRKRVQSQQKANRYQAGRNPAKKDYGAFQPRYK